MKKMNVMGVAFLGVAMAAAPSFADEGVQQGQQTLSADEKAEMTKVIETGYCIQSGLQMAPLMMLPSEARPSEEKLKEEVKGLMDYCGKQTGYPVENIKPFEDKLLKKYGSKENLGQVILNTFAPTPAP